MNDETAKFDDIAPETLEELTNGKEEGRDSIETEPGEHTEP